MGNPGKNPASRSPQAADELAQDQLDQAAGGGDRSTDSIWIDLGFPVKGGEDGGDAEIESRSSSRLTDRDEPKK